MAKLTQPFNARNFNPEQGLGGLPLGKHLVIVSKSEVKPVKDKNSGYLQLDLTITQGEHSGLTGAHRLNLYNEDQTTVRIAHQQLSAVCHVTGVLDLQDSQQLHGIPFMVEVGPQKNKPEYTEVKRVFDANGNEPKFGGQPQQQQPANQGQQPQQQPAQQGGWNQNQPQGNQQPQQQGNGGGWNQNGQQQPQNQGVQNNVAMPENGAQQQPNQQAGGWQQNGQQPQQQSNGGWNQNQQPNGNAQPSWGQ